MPQHARLESAFPSCARTKLQFGYRYLDLGSTDAELLFDGTTISAGKVALDLHAHELVLAARYAYHQKPLDEMHFPWPRWLGGRDDGRGGGKPVKPTKRRRWLPSWLGGERRP